MAYLKRVIMKIPNWQRKQLGDFIFGTPSWVVDGQIVHNLETQLNHIGVARNTRRKVGRSGRALCGEMILDQDALCHELEEVSNFVPVIADLPKCRQCKRIVMSWIADDEDILF